MLVCVVLPAVVVVEWGVECVCVGGGPLPWDVKFLTFCGLLGVFLKTA